MVIILYITKKEAVIQDVIQGGVGEIIFKIITGINNRTYENSTKNHPKQKER